ncbi:MAG: OmpA family protein [Erythrobacter sp.]|uniref:OmpA family protein n=1 Tax=Erythrobacter sp. TaxID=1042 RepID=UPI00262745A7|nr:OmpA family protein [Erythrobacter sp.]MDJ0979561.1 OmpA family protein [Erythrobacter sp.]
MLIHTMPQRLKLTPVSLAALLCLSLTACAPESPRTPAPDASESVSILRPEIEPPEPEATEPALEAYTAIIGFPDGGSALDADAVAILEEALQSPQIALDGPITLGAHSDSAGTDAANLDATEERGLAVAGWLIDNGIEVDRITVIAFGEQNPIAPNALPDGSPNEAGRAANRRVEIEIPVPILTVSAAEDAENAADPEASVEARD